MIEFSHMPPKKRVRIANQLTAEGLATLLEVPATVVIKALFEKGVARTASMIVEMETARCLAIDMGYELINDDDAPDGHAAAVPQKPKLPEGGNDVGLLKPHEESDSDLEA